MGYGFVIYQDNKKVYTSVHGLKRTAKDGGELNFDNTSRMHIASMSKTLTAIATLQLLKRDGLTTDDKIKDYLPPDWHLGPNIAQITFKDLLTHRSGIRANNPGCDGETYENLRCKIREGVNADTMKVASYQNMNFALMRIIIPKLEGYDHLEQGNDTSTARKYIHYVRQNIFNPSGLSDKGFCFPNKNDKVFYYNWPYKGGHGNPFYNYSETCGAYGWYVSVDDYGKIINTLFNTENLLTTEWRDTMTTNSLGCYTYRGKQGGYFWHNGGWSWNDNTGSGSMNSCWMYYPGDIIAVAIVNSDIPGWFPDLLAHAYDRAWKK